MTKTDLKLGYGLRSPSCVKAQEILLGIPWGPYFISHYGYHMAIFLMISRIPGNRPISRRESQTYAKVEMVEDRLKSTTMKGVRAACTS